MTETADPNVASSAPASNGMSGNGAIAPASNGASANVAAATAVGAVAPVATTAATTTADAATATANGTAAPATANGAAAPAAPAPPLFDAERRATELAILDALRAVVDPEIGMNVVELALIKQILLGENETEIKMILTTPFCPYAGSMIAQVTEQAESVVEHPVKVTLLAERWDPRDAGLMW